MKEVARKTQAMKKFLITLFLFFTRIQMLSAGHFGNSTLLIPQSSLMETALPLSVDDEMKIIEQLIIATSRQLEIQKQMKELMMEFKKQREEFIQGNQTKSHAGKMVRTARRIYEMITSNHLEHLFAKDYLDELTFFSSIAGKTAVTRP
jgi:hypothetical protein